MIQNERLRTNFEQIFSPDEIGQDSKVKINEILSLAAKEGLPPAANDATRNMLFVIDQQRGFMENGDLAVPGSFGDVERLGGFIYRNLHKITQFALTKDVHSPLQIFHPCWWVNKDGENPKPVETVITLEDVEDGVWTPQFFKQESIEYLKLLKKGGKREMRIWTYHCLEGTSGVEFESQFMNLVYYHTVARKINPIILEKGKDQLSEMYGAFYREDGVASEENKAFLDGMVDYDAIYVAGQALSHCVLETLTHMLEYHKNNANFTKKIHLLIDCTSNIPGCEVMAAKAIDELVNKYGIQVVRAEGLDIN